MQTEQIVALLIAERDRLSRAIDALQGGAKRQGRPSRLARVAANPNVASAAAPSAKPKRKMSAAGRKAIAEAARRRWAAIKAAKGK